MDDEFYDADGHDAGQFEDSEEESHFYMTISEFLDLLDIYSPQFVMMTMWSLMKEREMERSSLNSIN
jgi:hypothetical protein|tara:strand:- start:112 stop:312 length:201 start_codon:yes stop_codon:yes gene_type:complete